VIVWINMLFNKSTDTQECWQQLPFLLHITNKSSKQINKPATLLATEHFTSNFTWCSRTPLWHFSFQQGQTLDNNVFPHSIQHNEVMQWQWTRNVKIACSTPRHSSFTQWPWVWASCSYSRVFVFSFNATHGTTLSIFSFHTPYRYSYKNTSC